MVPKKQSKAEQFVCLMEPTGTWAVWDDWTGQPAELGDKPLVGVREIEAREAYRVLIAPFASRRLASRPIREPTS
jgi:hypothetical protein